MSAKTLNRRDFLRLSTLAAAGTALAGCAPAAETPAPTPVPAEPTPTTPAPTPVPAEPTPTTPAPAEVVTLEIMASNPEYSNAERQIWDVFEQQFPNIKVELFDVNEDTQDAFRAKVAGGYTPCFAQGWAFANAINEDNYQDFLEMSTITGIPWDKFTHDPINLANEFYGWGLRGFSPFKGFTWTWVYHADLMEEAGLNPRDDVKTQDDLKAWLQAGTEWVATRDDIDFFWDMGWEGWMCGSCYPVLFSLPFADGQIENDVAMWKGEIAVNSPESPARHFLQFFKEAYDSGWLPENYWTREWETDMEASFIAKKSMVLIHGPWPWDKAVAADPTVQLAGIPASPPAEEGVTWMQWWWPPSAGGGETTVLARAVEQPWWPECETAIVWWNNAEAIKMRAEVLGVDTFLEGVEVELDSPQWNGCVKEIGRPGGKWADVVNTAKHSGEWGPIQSKRIPGSPGIHDRHSGGMVEKIAALMKGEITVQDYLDWGQSNWEQSFEL